MNDKQAYKWDKTDGQKGKNEKERLKKAKSTVFKPYCWEK